MLAHEPQHPLPVPERAPRREAMVDDRGVVVPHARRRHVPPLPPRPRGAVAEVDVLAVHAEARVEAADRVEQLAAQEQERAEQPVGLDRLLRPLVQQVVPALALERREQQPPRRPAYERPARRRGAPPRPPPAARPAPELWGPPAPARPRP